MLFDGARRPVVAAGDPGVGDGDVVSPETASAVRQIIADATTLKRLLDDLHPAPDDTAPLQAVAAAMALTGQAAVERARGEAEKDRSTAEFDRLSKRLEAKPEEAPIPGFVRDAGLSLERLANGTAERYPYGWHLRFEVPGELLEKDPNNALKRSRYAWTAGQVLIALVAGALIALLAVKDSKAGNITSSTAGVAAVVGGWAAVVLLPALAGIGLVRWRASRRVSIDLARQAPGAWVLAGVAGANAAPENAAIVPGARLAQSADTNRSNRQAADGKASQGKTPAASPASAISREPVLLGSLLTGGGTLALGLSGALGTSALAAVSAGLVTLAGLFVRELVTPTESK